MVISTWGITSGVDYVSPQRLAQLEQIVFEKIRQKTLPKDDEGITVKKAFKYFDLTDQGTIDIRQFAQALAKFGCVFSEKEIVALFNKYDQDRTGKLCFDEFCGLIARMGAGTNPNLNPVFKLAREPPKQTLAKIKGELQKKGQHSVRKMHRVFNNSDKNKQGVLNRQEFQWAMKVHVVALIPRNPASPSPRPSTTTSSSTSTRTSTTSSPSRSSSASSEVHPCHPYP